MDILRSQQKSSDKKRSHSESEMEEVSAGAGSGATTSTITATTPSFLLLPWNLPLLSAILAGALAQFLKLFTTWSVRLMPSLIICNCTTTIFIISFSFFHFCVLVCCTETERESMHANLLFFSFSFVWKSWLVLKLISELSRIKRRVCNNDALWLIDYLHNNTAQFILII